MRTRPMTPAVGLEIWDVDLSLRDDADTAEALTALLLRYGVLVFRDQRLDRDSHVAFASWFGRPEPSPKGLASHPEIVRIEHDASAPPSENIWHADLSFLPQPPLAAALRAVEVPDSGGDTLFADMRDVWTRLPDPIRSAIAELTAEHDIAKWAGPDRASDLRAIAPVVRHAVVRTHPETGEAILFVNPAYTTRIVDLGDADSAAMLDFLFRQISTPEVQCRVRWEPGTVVLWDNRSVLHYATGDYLPARRVMERVSIAGSTIARHPPQRASLQVA